MARGALEAGASARPTKPIAAIRHMLCNLPMLPPLFHQATAEYGMKWGTRGHRMISCFRRERGDGAIANATEQRQSVMAGTALRGLEGQLPHAAIVDADRRQDPPRADALAQSFLARCALRWAEGPDHVVHSLRRPQLPARFRFFGSRVARIDLRWGTKRSSARPAVRSGILY